MFTYIFYRIKFNYVNLIKLIFLESRLCTKILTVTVTISVYCTINIHTKNNENPSKFIKVISKMLLLPF